jgi:hypothetical protein
VENDGGFHQNNKKDHHPMKLKHEIHLAHSSMRYEVVSG